jgi:Ulp1 family protease
MDSLMTEFTISVRLKKFLNYSMQQIYNLNVNEEKIIDKGFARVLKQDNGYDCGLYVLKYVENIVGDKNAQEYLLMVCYVCLINSCTCNRVENMKLIYRRI